MLVVSDTSPLTALLQIGRAELLRQLFTRVIIPPAVQAELQRERSALPEWLEVIAPQTIPTGVTNARLDPGETEALALALELHADTVLMDERIGRRIAETLGLHTTGVLGCLVLAKREGHLPAVAPVIAELQTIAGCWFAAALIEAILKACDDEILSPPTP